MLTVIPQSRRNDHERRTETGSRDPARLSDRVGRVCGSDRFVDKRCKASTCTEKRCTHMPQAKVLKFLVAILAGLEDLWDISLSSRPLDKDSAVAGAWGQPAWVDYSGVSRT